LDAPYLAALEKLVLDCAPFGIEALRHRFETFETTHGPCDAIPMSEPRQLRNQRLLALYVWTLEAEYHRARLQQLLESSFAIWVYRGGGECSCSRHEELDGLAVPSDHPFWLDYYPPNGWWCSCYVAGTRSAAGVVRLKGDPTKALPTWADPTVRASGPAIGIEDGFVGRRAPASAARIEALASLPIGSNVARPVHRASR